MKDYIETLEKYRIANDNLVEQLRKNNELMEEIIKTQMTIINFYKARSLNK